MRKPPRPPSRQAAASVDRRNAMWATRIRAAETPRDKAAVEWDWLRSEVRKIPSRKSKDEAWNTIRSALKTALDEIREQKERIADEVGPYPSSRPDRRKPPKPVFAEGFTFEEEGSL